MPTSRKTHSGSLVEWQTLAERTLTSILRRGFKIRAIRGLFPASLPKPAAVQVDLTVVASAKMKRLNRESLGRDYATDVLSFPTASFFRELGHLGDLVVCREVCLRQAEALGHSPKFELEVLLIHGMLHLLGLDHEQSDKDARRMATLEAAWLGKKSALRGGLISRSHAANSKARKA